MSQLRSAVVRGWFPSELVSQGEGLGEVHRPPVLGNGSDDRHSLFHWVDSEFGVTVGPGAFMASYLLAVMCPDGLRLGDQGQVWRLLCFGT